MSRSSNPSGSTRTVVPERVVQMIWDDLRQDWDAVAPAGPLTSIPPSERTEIVTHWNGPPLTQVGDHSKCLLQVRAIQRYHMESNGWDDIGYNGLVCRHGRSIEGRGIDVQGAHAFNHNRIGYGFMVLVGEGQTTTDAALDRLHDVKVACVARSGHDLTPLGHMDVSSTDCPGPQLEPWVKAGMPRITEEESMTEETAQALIKAIEEQGVRIDAVASALVAVSETLVPALDGIKKAIEPLAPAFAEDLDDAVKSTVSQIDAALQTNLAKVLSGFSVKIQYNQPEEG